MAVEGWDPGAGAVLGEAEVSRFLAAADALDTPDYGLDEASRAQLAPLARHEGALSWMDAAADLEDAQIEALIRLFTLAEGRFPAWQSGARSPVIPLARLLKERGSYPDGLTAWIKANTDNRFLPYGSLMDRL